MNDFEFDEFSSSVNDSRSLNDRIMAEVHDYCFSGEYDLDELGIFIEDDDVLSK